MATHFHFLPVPSSSSFHLPFIFLRSSFQKEKTNKEGWKMEGTKNDDKAL